MNAILRHSSLSLAVLLTLVLASAHFRIGFGARTIPLIAPPAPDGEAFKVQTKGGMILVTKMLVTPVRPPKIRGAALRDRGEALGGRIHERVETSTMTLAAH